LNKRPKLSWQDKLALNDSVKESLYNLGKCRRRVKRKSFMGGNRIEECGGKIIRVLAQYSKGGPIYEEKECLSCQCTFGRRLYNNQEQEESEK